MRCTDCGSVLVKERTYRRDLSCDLYFTCETEACPREGDNFGPAEEDGPSEVHPSTPGSPRASLIDGGRAVKR